MQAATTNTSTTKTTMTIRKLSNNNNSGSGGGSAGSNSSNSSNSSPKAHTLHKQNAASMSGSPSTPPALMDPNIEIEQISKKITEHADAIYRSWRSRGLAPTELLDIYKTVTGEDFFAGDAASGATAVAAAAAAAAGNTEGLQQLVNTFVIKDKEQRRVKTTNRSNSNEALLKKTIETTTGVNNKTAQQTIKKPVSQKLGAAAATTLVRAKSPTNTAAAAAATTTTEAKAAKTIKTAKNEACVQKKAAEQQMPAATTKKTARSALDGNLNYDINLGLDMKTLTRQQAENILKISELLHKEQQKECAKMAAAAAAAAAAKKHENNTDLGKMATASTVVISADAAAATAAAAAAAVDDDDVQETEKNTAVLRTAETTITAPKTSDKTFANSKGPRTISSSKYNKNHMKSDNSVGVNIDNVDGPQPASIALLNAVGTRTIKTTDTNSEQTTATTTVAAAVAVVANTTTTANKHARIVATNSLAALPSSLSSTGTITSSEQKVVQSIKSNDAADNKLAHKFIKTTTTTAAKATVNNEHIVAVSDALSEPTTTENHKLVHAKEKSSLNRSRLNNSCSSSSTLTTTTTTGADKRNVSANTTTKTHSVANTVTNEGKGMEIGRTTMPTLNKVKPTSGRAALFNGQDKNLGRPILTRGSVAERVLMFEKCPDVRNAFLNIKRPDSDASHKSQMKVKLHTPPSPHAEQISLQKEIRETKKYIPRFYFPHGKPQPTIAMERVLRGILSAFDSFPNNQVTKDELPRILKICGLPFYWRMPVMVFCQQSNNPGLVERQRFVEFWKQMNVYCHDAASRFVYILSRGQRCRSYILPEDLVPLVQDVVDTHPGLAFLKEATEFHSRYVHTVISRIYYSVNRSWTGKISIAELKRSELLEILSILEEEDDINQIMAFFSYEHFYVIYCKFWELDKDHDLLINQEDLSRHSDHALSTRIIERIFSSCVAGNNNKNAFEDEPKMAYTDFVWFILSEEDKRTPTAIEYWFRCMDIDGDGVISMYELEYFYEEQQQRMEAIGIECLPFEDCLCQMLDMIKPKRRNCITLSDLKHCKMTHVFFDTFFNLEKYLDHEQRDPFASQRDEYTSDWDRFAAQEYELLITEENE